MVGPPRVAAKFFRDVTPRATDPALRRGGTRILLPKCDEPSPQRPRTINMALYFCLMAREKKPSEDQLPLLEDLSRAAALRSEAYRYYLSVFQRALKAGVGPSVIARYARISPQAANSTKNRLAATDADVDAPATVEDVLDRVGFNPRQAKERPGRGPRRRRNAS